MLSYQHGYHAGGRADSVKHAIHQSILSDIISRRGKLESFCYIETHSGRGKYDLSADMAAKTGEAAKGIKSLINAPKPPKSLLAWLGLVKRLGGGAKLPSYPGSPALARHIISGPQDRFVFVEKHPTEFKHLSQTMAGKSVRCIKGDGYSEALRLTPRRSERFIVFVDPSYETEQDLVMMAEWVPRALQKWPDAIVIVWLPRFQDEREVAFGQWLAELEQGVIAGAIWHRSENETDTALIGSAMIAFRVNPELSRKVNKIAEELQNYWQ